MKPGKRTLADVLTRVLFSVLGVGFVAIAVFVSVRSHQAGARTAEKVRRAPEVVLLGHAFPIRGSGPTESRRARYLHRVELLDGRTANYVSEELFSARTCVEVRARELPDRLVILELSVADERCEKDDLQGLEKLTR